MSQDTRKDKRAKVVNLNVRYKSATVDEFIENHSHDVSRGGIFVKTASPFPPGTLLKFEIRLAGDRSVIAGVGRVVWKRESNQAGAEKPAGMGVKFIKIDDASRALIDRLVAEKADAGQAFTSELADTTLSSAPPPASPPARPEAKPAARPAGATTGAAKPEPPRTGLGPPPKRNATVIGVAPAGGPPSANPPTGTATAARPSPTTSVPTPAMGATTLAAIAGATATTSSDRPAEAKPAETKSVPPRPQGARKATMIGIGTSAPMFPNAANAASDQPAPEPTVMKQAAELLEEALKEAGGSLDEIGQNPLFSVPTTGPSTSNTATLVGGVTTGAGATPAPATAASLADTVASSVTATPAPVTPAPLVGSPTLPLAVPEPTPASEKATAPIERVAMAVVEESSDVLSQPTTPMRRLSDDLEPAKKKSGGGGVVFAVLAVLLAAGGGAYAWSNGLFGGRGGEPVPMPSAEPSSNVAAVVDAGETTTRDADTEEPDGAAANAAAMATGALADAAADAATSDAGPSEEDGGDDRSASKKSEAPTPAKAPARRHTGSRKPAAAAAATEPTATEPTPTPTETAEPTPSEPKPNAEPKPSTESTPAESKPATESKPAESKPAETKPAEPTPPSE